MNNLKIKLMCFIFSLIGVGILFFILKNNGTQKPDIIITAPLVKELVKEVKDCDNYEEIQHFKEPISVTWTAKFTGCLSSCWGASFTRIPSDPKYPRFSGYVPDNGDRIADKFTKEGQILKIYGKWTDVSNSYGSVFDNKCVPTVEIDKIEIVNKL